MIFHRALLREFAGLAGAVFLTLFAIALTTRLIRILGQAAGGKIPSDAVFAFVGFFALHVLPVLLSLTVFITVLLTLARSYRDSEMVVWFSSGMSLAAWIRPVLMFSVPLVVVVAVLSLVISPWASQMSAQFQSRLDARDDLTRVNPGVFGESRSRERVYFVESIAGDTTGVQNVFVNSVQNQRYGVMMSRKGLIEKAPNGDRFLVLLDGQRYEGTPGEADFRVMEFERYATRIEAKEGAEPESGVKTQSTLELLDNPDPTARGELLWRIGLPVSTFILSLLAIPMSFVNPRAGRSINLLFGLLAYIVYANMLTISQARVAQGKLAFSTGWWLVHAVMFAVLLVMFAHRLSLFRIRSWR
ncbi:MAG: LPS export ABC transporter permease LptF [Betaproteobacteria bacterium]|nr:LPS export ABC transporter permease LptF [Betaproteobacteria bacterium]